MSRSATGVTLRNIHKAFDPDVTVANGIDLAIEPGKFTALLGPSGCGKTTLLRMVGGLVEPDQGEIEFTTGSPTKGFCFQEPRLLPWRNVRGNIGLPLELENVDEPGRSKAVDAVIDLVGLGDAADRLPAALSGGMQMRTALARSLVASPGLLLLDEPFAALDEVTRFRLDEEVSRLVRARDVTVLMVTHSIAEAVFLADDVVVLSSRPARVVERFEVDFAIRDVGLRMTPAFAEISSRVYEALRSGTKEIS